MEVLAQKTLRSLNISHNKLSQNEAVIMAHKLEEWPNLEYLDMSHNRIGTGGCNKMTIAMQQLDANQLKAAEQCSNTPMHGILHKVDLRHNNISPMRTDPPLLDYLLDPNTHAIVFIEGGVGDVIEMMLGRYGPGREVRGPQSCNLVDLDFGDKTMDDLGCQVMAKIIKSGRCLNLKRLLLTDSGIEVEGMKHLCSMFRRLKDLQQIDVSDNSIGDDGVRLFIDALGRDAPTVQDVNLSNCGFGDLGAKHIADGLAKIKNLTKIHLNNIQCGDKGILSLERAVARLRKTNISMIELLDHDIRGPNIEEESLDKLEKACESQKIELVRSEEFGDLDDFTRCTRAEDNGGGIAYLAKNVHKLDSPSNRLSPGYRLTPRGGQEFNFDESQIHNKMEVLPPTPSAPNDTMASSLKPLGKLRDLQNTEPTPSQQKFIDA